MSHNKSSATTARNKARLQHLLSNPHNRYCADCKTSRNPRWASWNLGVFICIRCSGIHRSLGTHITRVKSVDLDSWTDEQTSNMELWGNEKGNLYWESKLFEMDSSSKGHNHDGRGDGYVPLDGKLESFVRTKYVLGKWKKDTERETFASSSSSPSSSVSNVASTSSILQNDNTSMLDDLLGNSNRVEQSRFQSNVPRPAPKSTINPVVDLLKQSTTSSVTSSPSPSQSVQPTGNSVNRGDLKKNILSLYSTPTNSNQNLVSQQFKQPQPQMMQQQFSSTSSINGSANSSSSNVWNTNNNTNSNNNLPRGDRSYVNNDPFKNVWQ